MIEREPSPPHQWDAAGECQCGHGFPGCSKVDMEFDEQA
jgi:hypothetical protein